MIVQGISEGFHNAATALVDDNGILYASEAERHSKVKNDRFLGKHLRELDADVRVFYEDYELKNERRLAFGQSSLNPKIYNRYSYYRNHHESHAASAYYTSPFDNDVVVVVIDAIGEWDTSSIWTVKNGNLEKVWSEKYPNSLGLFYSAITKRLGLKPNEDEYITMGMAAYGEPTIDMLWCFPGQWHKGFSLDDFKGCHPYDIAASAQLHLEFKIKEIMLIAQQYGKNLCYAGGVALNCVANSKIREMFDMMWVMPNPGDAGASLGAALAHTKRKTLMQHNFLGTNIDRPLNPEKVVDELLKNRVAGVANGKAEFGPRALGNRSLLGDVRYNIRDRVNAIKKRQKFRPFAPAILSEYYEEYFDGWANPYMSFTAWAKHDYDCVTHVDGSARVQVVHPDSPSALRPILEEYHSRTGVPMLLNTSLNIKGMPMVDTWEDAKAFEQKYKVRVF